MDLSKMYTATFDRYDCQNKGRRHGGSFFDIKDRNGKSITIKGIPHVKNMPNNLKHGDTITFASDVSDGSLGIIKITHVNFMEV